MKNFLKLFFLLAFLNLGAQGKPDKFNFGLIVPNATEVTTTDSIPTFDANLKMNTWISAANLLAQIQLETFTESGTRAGLNALTTIGDYDDSGNGTKIQISDAAEKISLLAEKLSIGTTDVHTLNSTVFQKTTADPSTGDALAINVSILERTANPTGTGYFYGENKTITRSGTDNETGTKGADITVQKTGNFNSTVLYGQDLKTTLTGGGTTSFLIGQVLRVKALGTETLTVNGVARGQSADIEINNPNFTGYVQAMHPTLNLKKGNITGGELIFMDYDLDHTDLDLNVTGDLTYIAGGGGSDVAAMKTKLEGINKKFRFIHNQGVTESDFLGIINYNGDVSNIINATNKVLVNKEYLESLNYIYGAGTANYLPKFSDVDTIGDSQIFDNGTNVGIGTATPSAKLEIINTDFPTNDHFLISTSEATPGDVFTVEGSKGNVGIGTASPDVKFDVESTESTSGIRIKNTNNGYASFDIESNRGIGANLGGLRYKKTGETYSQAEINYVSGTRLDFLLGDGIAPPPIKVSILKNGNVGVGKNIPSEKLEVVGNIKATSYIALGKTSNDILLGDGSTIALNSVSTFKGVSGYDTTEQLITTVNTLQVISVNTNVVSTFIVSGANTEFEATVAGYYRLESIPQFLSGGGLATSIEQLWQIDTGTGYVTDPKSVIENTIPSNSEGIFSCVTVVYLGAGDSVRAMWASSNTNAKISPLTTITGGTAPSVQQFITFEGK